MIRSASGQSQSGSLLATLESVPCEPGGGDTITRRVTAHLIQFGRLLAGSNRISGLFISKGNIKTASLLSFPRLKMRKWDRAEPRYIDNKVLDVQYSCQNIKGFVIFRNVYKYCVACLSCLNIIINHNSRYHTFETRNYCALKSVLNWS